MIENHLTDSIRNYFIANNFYAYRYQAAKIADGFLAEYIGAADPLNKRNLRLDKFWSDIKSFGKPREIIAIDLGGTNLNMFKVNVVSDLKMEVKDSVLSPFYENKTYTPEVLFGDLRKQIDDFVPSSRERESLKSIVFIFSYPIEQLVRDDGYVDAVCTYFGKTRKSEGIVGMQVGLEFQKYLRDNGYPNVSVSVTNDTPIYSLAAKGFELVTGRSYDAAMNIIVGTGMNISSAYDESNLEGAKGLRVINTECGDFKSAIMSRFDLLFAESNDTPDRYLNEKMISGAWLFDVFKIIMADLVENNVIQKDALAALNFEELNSKEVETMIKERSLNESTHEIVEFVWRELHKRGGALCGMMIAAVFSELSRIIGKDNIRVIVIETGSVIHRGLGFRESMMDTIDNEIGRRGLRDKVSYEFGSPRDTSALGATIFDNFFTK